MYTTDLADNVIRAKAIINFNAGDLHNYYERRTRERRVYQDQLNKCALEERRKQDRRRK